MRHNSASGPTTKRATTQAGTLKTFDIQMPFLGMSRSWRMTGGRDEHSISRQEQHPTESRGVADLPRQFQPIN